MRSRSGSFKWASGGEFATLVGEQMNTDFVAKMMLGYLRDGKPTTMEAVADEMLGILELRKRCIEKKKR